MNGQWLLLTFEKVQPAIGVRLPCDSQIARPEPASPPTSLAQSNIIEHQPTPETSTCRSLFRLLESDIHPVSSMKLPSFEAFVTLLTSQKSLCYFIVFCLLSSACHLSR